MKDLTNNVKREITKQSYLNNGNNLFIFLLFQRLELVFLLTVVAVFIKSFLSESSWLQRLPYLACPPAARAAASFQRWLFMYDYPFHFREVKEPYYPTVLLLTWHECPPTVHRCISTISWDLITDQSIYCCILVLGMKEIANISPRKINVFMILISLSSSVNIMV